MTGNNDVNLDDLVLTGAPPDGTGPGAVMTQSGLLMLSGDGTSGLVDVIAAWIDAQVRHRVDAEIARREAANADPAPDAPRNSTYRDGLVAAQHRIIVEHASEEARLRAKGWDGTAGVLGNWVSGLNLGAQLVGDLIEKHDRGES